MRLSVVGTGYLGTTHAVAMATLGHQVVGVDADARKIDDLNAGRLPFYEPGLADLLRERLADGSLRFTKSIAEAAVLADVHFVCVGTPQRRDGAAADLSQVEAAIAALVSNLRPDAIVVGKSTVPVGTASRLMADVSAARAHLVWNPEFLREGHALDDTLRPDRIVLGVIDDYSGRVVCEVYQPILDRGTPLIITDYATAELVKVAANSFLATKLSFINMMAEVCEAAGADVTQLAGAIGLDERIGRRYLRPGIGFGGGCLPKDIRAFAARAEELGVRHASALLHVVEDINRTRRTRVLDLARRLCDGSLSGARIAVLGASFKPDSDDIRDSPALDIAQEAHDQGAVVVVYDPEAMHNAKDRHPMLGYATSAMDACVAADLVMHLTEWDEFARLHPADLDRVVAHRRMVDGRCTLSAQTWREAGWEFEALGRPSAGLR